MERIQKQKAVCEETDQEGEEGDEKEDTEKDKRAGWAKLQAILVRPERRTSKQEEKHSKIEEQEWKDHR